MSNSIVRLAFDGSVACTPARFHSTQESTVPNARCGVGVDAALGEQPLELGGREVGVEHEAGALPHQRLDAGGAQVVAARRGATVLPDDRPVAGPTRSRRSHTTTVSRWLVMPIAGDRLAVERGDDLGERRPGPRARCRRRRARPSRAAGSAAGTRGTRVARGGRRRRPRRCARRSCRHRWRGRRSRRPVTAVRRRGRVRARVPAGPELEHVRVPVADRAPAPGGARPLRTRTTSSDPDRCLRATRRPRRGPHHHLALGHRHVVVVATA